MKKHFSLLTLIFLTSFMHAQYSDLGSLSEGELTNFQSILDNDDHLYGYLAIYQLDNVDKNTKKFEYVLLDKNLNQVSNNEFPATSIAGNYSGYLASNGNLILRPSLSIEKNRDYKIQKPKVYTVNLAENTVEEKINYCFENDSLVTCEQEDVSLAEENKNMIKERKENDSVYKSMVMDMADDGYLVYDYTEMIQNKYQTYKTDESYQRFDKELNKLWEFDFNQGATKDNSEAYYIFAWEDDYAYFIKLEGENNDYQYSLAALDLETGELMSEYNINENFPEFSIGNLFYYNGKGIENTFNNKDFFRILSLYGDGTNNTGYMTFNYDKKNNFFYADKFEYLDLNKVADNIEFEKYGDIAGEKASIITRDIYFLEDGSVGMLTEKTRYKGKKVVTTDMVVITTDKDLNPKEVTVLQKDKSKTYSANDYLFSQYINDDKDVVFFYRDYQEDNSSKDKNWVLYINTIIDGKFHQEQIPISSDENFIYPSLAKEGYILLREFNKNDKYDQIRLERLNY